MKLFGSRPFGKIQGNSVATTSRTLGPQNASASFAGPTRRPNLGPRQDTPVTPFDVRAIFPPGKPMRIMREGSKITEF